MSGRVLIDGELPAEAQKILIFWFGPESANTTADLSAKLIRWFGDPSMARDLREQFVPIIEAASDGGLVEWEASPLGKLALILILDQFKRSLYGLDDPRAFEDELRGSRLALELVEAGIPAEWSEEQHGFAILPLGHAEDLAMHRPALSASMLLVQRTPLHLRPVYEMVTAQLIRFTAVIERFGRYPHRNEALGRESTAEELEFLKSWRIASPAHDYSEQIAVAKSIEQKLAFADSEE